MRDVLVHYHLFKNAGSSVDGVLRRHFGAAWARLDGSEPWQRVEDGELLDFLQESPQIRALSSHQARPPGPELEGLRIHPLIFLRDPIDRAGSVYEFERRMPATASPGSAMANELEFPDYVDWRVEEGDGGTLCNFQTLMLGWREGDIGSASAAARAGQLVDSLPCLGLVESFEVSMARISAQLAPVFGAMPPPLAAHNRSIGRAGSLAQRLEQIRLALGEVRYRRLCEANALDIELHARATKRFAAG